MATRNSRTSAAKTDDNTVTARIDPAPGIAPPAELIEALKALSSGGRSRKTIVRDDDIQYHPGTAIMLPESPSPMDLERARRIIDAKIEEQEQIHTFSRVFDYRPEDGANATADVLHQMFGVVVGKDTMTMFGPRPPQYRTIKVAYNKTRDVPWGEITIPVLPGASIELDATMGKMGPVFAVAVTSPKKHRTVIEALFAAIEAQLKVASIYRGKALEGAHELTHLDLSGFDANRIVFADHVRRDLEAALFQPLRDPASVRDAGMSLRRAVLVYGPFGTGKTSLGLITAQIATAHDWTFLIAKAGRDNIREVMQTAALYARTVVLVEDIDAHVPASNRKDAMSELLDLFDGSTAKGKEIILVATTNHIEDVAAGMLRPGRLDYVIEVAGLDRNGTEGLIRAVIPTDRLAADVDFDSVFAAMPHFQPAWVKAVADRAQSYALARTHGQAAYRITTEDLVFAARSLHPQLELMRQAVEGHPEPTLHIAFREAVKDAINDGIVLVDDDGYPVRGGEYLGRTDRDK